MASVWRGFPLPLGAWDGLRYFIVALPEPSIYMYIIILFAFWYLRKGSKELCWIFGHLFVFDFILYSRPPLFGVAF